MDLSSSTPPDPGNHWRNEGNLRFTKVEFGAHHRTQNIGGKVFRSRPVARRFRLCSSCHEPERAFSDGSELAFNSRVADWHHYRGRQFGQGISVPNVLLPAGAPRCSSEETQLVRRVRNLSRPEVYPHRSASNATSAANHVGVGPPRLKRASRLSHDGFAWVVPACRPFARNPLSG